jgi:hypothetical protein
MAHGAVRIGTEAVNILKDTWDSQFALDPTEEAIVAPLVSMPNGTQKIGKKLHLRKIAAATIQSATATTTLVADNLSYNQNVEQEVTVSPLGYYSGIELNPDTLEQIVDDGEAVAGWRKQLMACLTEKIDEALLDLAGSASLTEVGASFTEALWQAALAKLAKNAKSKFKIGRTPYNLVLHPDRLANALQISALREYQIRGSAGSAQSGALVTTYGANIEETGKVKTSGGTHYIPLFLKDAWALGFNQKPKMLEAQNDGLVVRYTAYTSFGCAEWFDSSIVSCNIT